MSGVNLSLPCEAYRGNEPFAFVSYAHSDAQQVYPEIARLHRMGYRIWFDEGIDPGNEWPEEIANAIAKAAQFIVFITANAVDSRNVRNEINFALKHEKPFLAVHLSETKLPPGMDLQTGAVQAVLKWRMDEAGYVRKLQRVLTEALKRADAPARKMPFVPELEPPPPVREGKDSEPQANYYPSLLWVSKHRLVIAAVAGAIALIAVPGILFYGQIEDKPGPVSVAEGTIAPSEMTGIETPVQAELDTAVTSPEPEEDAAAPTSQSEAVPDGNEAPLDISWEESGKEAILALPGNVTMSFAKIPSGTFLMGSPDAEVWREADEGPQRRVTIRQDFWLGKYEVTQAQWESVMPNNPSYFKGDAQLPVEYVSWDNCQSFIQKLNAQGVDIFRLPSEAEWEYACRAGTTTRFYWGDDPKGDEINNYAWYSGNSGRDTIHPVGLKQPNAWGLYDMSGNVREWCEDDWHKDYKAAPNDGRAWVEVPRGSYRVFRGGWNDFPENCRSAKRSWNTPEGRNRYQGFRLAASYLETAESSVVTTVSSEPEEVAALPETESEAAPGETEAPLDISWEESGKEAALTLPDDVQMEFVKILPGEFIMGSPESEPDRDDDELQHEVKLAHGFWLGKYEVTQAQWDSVMDTNPSKFKGADLPVESLMWDDAQAFIGKLNEVGQGIFLLPSEMQWEYACRAGSTTAYCFGNDASQLTHYAWYSENSEKITHPIGKKKPNVWGLYDMHGNIKEWCVVANGADRIYVVRDWNGKTCGVQALLRGGSIISTPKYCRSACRWGLPLTTRWLGDCGIRIARNLSVNE